MKLVPYNCLTLLLVICWALGPEILAQSNRNGAAGGGTTAVVGRNSCKRNYEFDNLVMSIQWPLSYCYEKQQCNLQVAKKKRWNIHGLWPNRVPKRRQSRVERRQANSTTGNRVNIADLDISFCCGPQYDQSLLNGKLLQELQEKWPTLQSNGNNDNFWRHEWKKHGTCARGVEQLKNQTSYFESSLKLYDRFDLKRLKLESGKRYQLVELHRQIDPLAGGKRVRIECSLASPGNGTTSTPPNSNSIFSEIHICLDKELRPIDCTRNDDFQCKRNILFP